jgi:hypothetical protein
MDQLSQEKKELVAAKGEALIAEIEDLAENGIEAATMLQSLAQGLGARANQAASQHAEDLHTFAESQGAAFEKHCEEMNTARAAARKAEKDLADARKKLTKGK